MVTYNHEELKSFWRIGYKIQTIKKLHAKYRAIPDIEVSRLMKRMFEKELNNDYTNYLNKLNPIPTVPSLAGSSSL